MNTSRLTRFKMRPVAWPWLLMTGGASASVFSALPLSARFWLVARYRFSMKFCTLTGTSSPAPPWARYTWPRTDDCRWRQFGRPCPGALALAAQPRSACARNCLAVPSAWSASRCAWASLARLNAACKEGVALLVAVMATMALNAGQ